MNSFRSSRELIDECERMIRRDPAHRGLLSHRNLAAHLPIGQLGLAAESLARECRSAWIVTGFFIPGATPPAAESDGPLGAVLLAAVLHDLGRRVELITDPHCYPLLRETALLCGLQPQSVRVYSEEMIPDFERLPPTHLIAIERVGPSHTLDSFQAQIRSGPLPLADFERKVPPVSRDHCHNMRGEVIDACTGTLHQLFELHTPANSNVRTIGIGDGGNEIGMGAIPWEILAACLPDPSTAKTICRIATHWNILAGTSNWGGYALAAAVAFLERRTDLLERFTSEQQFNLLSSLIDRNLVVDGVTRERNPTVDSLPFLTYIQPWSSMRRLLNLND